MGSQLTLSIWCPYGTVCCRLQEDDPSIEDHAKRKRDYRWCLLEPSVYFSVTPDFSKWTIKASHGPLSGNGVTPISAYFALWPHSSASRVNATVGWCLAGSNLCLACKLSPNILNLQRGSSMYHCFNGHSVSQQRLRAEKPHTKRTLPVINCISVIVTKTIIT